MRKVESAGKKILPGIWKLNRTTFIVRVQRKDPATGKKRNIRKLLTESCRRDAIRAREAMLAGHVPAGGMEAPASETDLPTVASFGVSWLQRKKARNDLSPHAQDRYASALDRLSQAILEARVDEVTPDMIERWMVSAITPRSKGKGEAPAKPGRKAKAGKFSPSTVNGWWRVLRTMLNDARRLHGLPSNPAEAVRPLPEVQDLEENNALTPAELARVLVQLRKEDRIIAMAAWVQAFTGLRWGEVSALKWSDLDDEGQLTVCRTAIKGSLVPSTKTRRKRAVVLPGTLLEELATYRNWLEVADHPGLSSGLMFPSESGKPLWASRMSNALKRARVAANITRRFTSHGFRRTMTDLLRQAAVDPVTAKAITGHATDRMREHYSTVGTEDLRQASDRVHDLLGPALVTARQEALTLAHDEEQEEEEKESTKESTAR